MTVHRLALLSACLLLAGGCFEPTTGQCAADDACAGDERCDVSVGLCVAHGCAEGGECDVRPATCPTPCAPEETCTADGRCVPARAVDVAPPVLAVELPLPSRPRSGPAVQVDPEPGFELAFRRDERIEVTVTSPSADLDPATVRVSVEGTDAVAAPATVAVPFTPCAATFCGRATVDLSVPQLRAFRANLKVRASASDRSGNPAEALAEVPVTRWRWSLSLGAHAIAASPALGDDGTLYVATGDPSGVVVALTPRGDERWRVVAGATVANPVFSRGVDPAGGARLYVASTRGASAVAQVLDAATGAPRHACPSAGFALPGEPVSMALLPAAPGRPESVIALLRGAGGLARITPDAAQAAERCAQTTVAGTPLPGQALAASGTDVFFGDDTGQTHAFTFEAGVAARPGWPRVLDTLANRLILPAAGQKLIGTGRTPDGVAELFVLEEDGTKSFRYPQPGVGNLFGPPVLDRAQRVLYTDARPQLTRVTPSTAGASAVTLAGQVRSGPVVGAAGRAYVGSSAALEALSEALELDWRLPLAERADAPLQLDCARTPGGERDPGRPGTLYAPLAGGQVLAVVVDDPGLEVTSGWPRVHHDPANTGNASTALDRFRCP